jgi:hypothetical protein
MPGTTKKTAAPVPSRLMKDQCKSDMDWMLSDYDPDEMGDLGMDEISNLIVRPYIRQAWMLGYQAGLIDGRNGDGAPMRLHGETGPLRIINHRLTETTVKTRK